MGNLPGLPVTVDCGFWHPQVQTVLVAVIFGQWRVTEDPPRATLIRLDQDVHHAIYNATHNAFLEDCLNRYLNLTLRAWVLMLDSVGVVAEMVDEHASLIDAVIEGDAQKASALAREHITDFENDFRAALGNPAVRLSVDRHRSSGI